MKILILCTINGAVSQMVHGYLQSFDHSLKVSSAATLEVGKIDELALNVMKEVNIDISYYPTDLIEEHLNNDWDYVITVCEACEQNYPNFSSTVKNKLYIPFEDPSLTTGTAEFVKDAYRKVRGEVYQTVRKLYREKLMEEPSCPCGANYFCRCE
ncbi:MAG: arsenate reductase ArsC [Phocaeicola sp.]